MDDYVYMCVCSKVIAEEYALQCFLIFNCIFFFYIAAGTVSDIPAPRDSVVSWVPPNPPQGIILYYNIRITKSDTGELVRLILMVNRTTFDVSSEVMSAGAYSVQVCTSYKFLLH